MLTAKPQKNRGAATSYFDEHLSHNDYYSQSETQAGRWIGIGVEKLGLNPGEAVTRDAFLKLCDNLHPETGEQLTHTTFKKRRVFFDFQCAPPKSVSILAVTMEDQRIVQAHREASEIAIRELEQFASTRIRMGGVEDRDRVTGNLVGAAFLHTSSRTLDPQLHTHFTLFNATFDSSEQRWKALQTSAMFDAIHYGTAVYRNELIQRLYHIGYQIRRTGSAFEIEGVNPKLIERFSKRSKERDVAVAREEKRLGRKLTRTEVAHVVHQTRPRKLKGASDEQVRAQQLGELGFFDKRSLRKVIADARSVPNLFRQPVSIQNTIDHAIAHVFERASVAPRHHLLEAALVTSPGQLDLAQLKAELNRKTNLVQVGTEYSTREILTKELFLIQTINAGVKASAPIIDRYHPPDRLGPDQCQALTHVLTSPDRFTGFRGLAGSGKSTTLMELERALQKEGRYCLFCAPTASAVDTLQKEGLDAVTLSKLLVDPNTHHRLSPQSIVVLDEAGAVGLDDLVKVVELALTKNVRVVFSGDTGQHASVARGDALRILEQYSSYRFAELTTIRRQKSRAFRKVVELAAANQTGKAFARLLELGAVTEVHADSHSTDHGQLYQQAAAAYLSAIGRGKSAQLVSPTWSEIEAVTENVRESLRTTHQLGIEEQTVQVFDSLSWTEAQKKNPGQFEKGQQIRFVRPTKSFVRNETAVVVAVQCRELLLRRADGNVIPFSPHRSAGCFDVGEVRDLKIAPGDRLLLQANAVVGNRRFINGERVQVKRVSGGDIELTDGRVLPARYRTFTRGYAVTSHSSQGRTVDEVLLVASSRSFAAVNREQFYVSISRGRERIHVFTDDADLLSRRVSESHERKAALELLAQRQQLRDDLSRLGFLHKKPATSTFPGYRVVRPIRVTRATRLAPVQRLIQLAEHVREWLGGKLKATPQPPTAAKITSGETIKPLRLKRRLGHHGHGIGV